MGIQCNHDQFRYVNNTPKCNQYRWQLRRFPDSRWKNTSPISRIARPQRPVNTTYVA